MLQGRVRSWQVNGVSSSTSSCPCDVHGWLMSGGEREKRLQVCLQLWENWEGEVEV